MKFSYLVFRAVRGLVWFFYPKTAIEGQEHLPEGACVIVGNHAKMNGPIIAELYIPGDREIWCAAEMMHLKEVPAYAFKDFWSDKPASVRWFYRLLSYLIAPLSVAVFNNAHCIGVYRDMRVVGTLRETVKRLTEGARIVIFPEHAVEYNGMVWKFRDGFVDLARMYRAKTGKDLLFVPMYTAPALKKAILGEGVSCDPAADPRAERGRICKDLMDRVTAIAVSQERHRIVPYPNMPKRLYPYNRTEEGDKV